MPFDWLASKHQVALVRRDANSLSLQATAHGPSMHVASARPAMVHGRGWNHARRPPLLCRSHKQYGTSNLPRITPVSQNTRWFYIYLYSHIQRITHTYTNIYIYIRICIYRVWSIISGALDVWVRLWGARISLLFELSGRVAP